MRRLTAATAFALCSATSFMAFGATPTVPYTTEHFDSNTDSLWTGLRNTDGGAPTADGQNYAWSNTNNTGSSVLPPSPGPGTASGAGELGGIFKKALFGAGHENFYAYSIGGLDLGPAPADGGGGTAVEASGVYHLTHAGTAIGTGSSTNAILIGFFHDATSYPYPDVPATPPDQTGGGHHNERPMDFVGFQINRGSIARGELYLPNTNSSYGNEDRTTDFATLTDGATVPFSMHFDPKPNGEEGRTAGLLTVTWDGVTKTISASDLALDDSVNDRMYYFGVMSYGGNPVVGDYVEAYVDDLTFNSAPEWAVNADGNWSNSANWASGIIPSAVGNTAFFGRSILANRTVTVDAPITVGSITFDNNANSHTIAGSSTLTIQGATLSSFGPTSAIFVGRGTQFISAPLQLNSDTIVNMAGSSTLTASNLLSSSVTLSKVGTGTLAVNNIRAAGLSVSSGVLRVLPSSLAAGVSKVNTLAVTGTGRLDLNNNKLITQDPAGTQSGGIYNGVQGLVQSGYAGGSWTGNGIYTSQPDALGTLTTIGVSTGAIARFLGPTDTAIWAGQTINGDSTLAMYTYTGDANLDGIIDGTDYFYIDNNVGTSADGYGNGDFNYDGIIDGTDYFYIDSNIVDQGAQFFAGSELLANGAAVPEPASFAVVAVAIGGLLTRRRR